MFGNAAYDKIKEKLSSYFPGARIMVQPNTVSGVNIKIVFNGFEDMSFHERKKLLDKALPDVEIAFFELLTPQEDELYGTDLSDLRPEDLPFWPNVLAERDMVADIRFLNSVDEVPKPPFIVTFYSIRGGVGRTTSLAYTALNLEKKGYRVVAVDMDLEAPGLVDVLGIPIQEHGKDRLGLVPLLHDIERGVASDIRNYMVRDKDREIFCLPAGQVSTAYVYELHQLNFPQYYRFESNPLAKVFEMLNDALAPDVILIDARTGFSEINGPLLFDFADLAVITFFPHPQTKEAFQLLARGILNHKNKRGFTPEMRFVISPVPPSDEKEKYYQRGIEWINEIGETIRSRVGQERNEVFTPEEMTTVIRYHEDVAFSDRVLEKQNVLQRYAAIAEWIEKFIGKAEEAEKEADLREKLEILESLTISTGQAEEQDNLVETFIKTQDYDRLRHPDTLLVTGKKGTGKTALFRMLLQEEDRFIPIKVMAPSKLYGTTVYLDRDGFAHVEKTLQANRLPWSTFWQVYILLRMAAEKPGLYKGELNERLQSLLRQPSQMGLIDFLERILVEEKITFRIQDDLTRLSRDLDAPIFLLFDGLDTGFGSGKDDLERRARAITGLFELWYDWDGKFPNIRFKIFLRKDIWDKITFQNKSHVWGRDIRIQWDQVNYIKTIGKQVLRSKPFVEYFQRKYKLPSEKIEEWDAEEVWTLLRLLVGERMKGGNTTYTRNWIWNRLADGNGDHSPRYLFQLFRVAIDLEKEEFMTEKNPYLRSLIRPRMLTKALPSVSEEAVNALREEYPELEQFMNHIRGKMSPLQKQELASFEHEIEIANESGLISVYERDGGVPVRYAVPDLYLKGLEMTRKGQA